MPIGGDPSAEVLLGLMPTSQLKANSTIYNTTISACEKGFTWAQAWLRRVPCHSEAFLVAALGV